MSRRKSPMSIMGGLAKLEKHGVEAYKEMGRRSGEIKRAHSKNPSMFTERQRRVVRKAANDGYLNGLLPDGVITWLSAVEPKSREDANIIVECVMGVAYKKGNTLEGLPTNEDILSEVAKMADRLVNLMNEYLLH